MLRVLAISNYRSCRELVVPLRGLNVVTGGNGVGKSNVYRALRLLAATAGDGAIPALAREGGLPSTLWAGPGRVGRTVHHGAEAASGSGRKKPVRMRLSFATDELSYAVEFGLPAHQLSPFRLDPEIKRECIWSGPRFQPGRLLVDRAARLVRVRDDEGRWMDLGRVVPPWRGLLAEFADPERTPEVLLVREQVRGWRFYDHFRTDPESLARHPQVGTRTPVLHHDGRDLAATWLTLVDEERGAALASAVEDAFPGSSVSVEGHDAVFEMTMEQPGMLRPLRAAELSDGTLRYLMWIAALNSTAPPELMVLNEPETSLHRDLLPAFARLVIEASKRCQVWVVTHATELADALADHDDSNRMELVKEHGETRIAGLELLDAPRWEWP